MEMSKNDTADNFIPKAVIVVCLGLLLLAINAVFQIYQIEQNKIKVIESPKVRAKALIINVTSQQSNI
jgi:hypothetical protein